jgi:hypothetical protein
MHGLEWIGFLVMTSNNTFGLMVKTLFKFGGLRMDQLVGSKKMFFKAIEWV